MNTEATFFKIKHEIFQLIPDATITLFGSRENGTATPESDWDILIQTPSPVNKILKNTVHEKLFPLSVEIGFINFILVNEHDWLTNPAWYSLRINLLNELTATSH